MSGKIDLHLHTNFSDGSHTPAGLIEKAFSENITTLSITDHDTVGALPLAENLCKSYGIEFINGVEFTVYVAEREVHILAYFFNREHPGFLKLINFCADERLSRAKRILSKLETMNVFLSIEDVLAEAGGATVTRPHIASAMIKKGYSPSFPHAFEVYLGNYAPAYERKTNIDPAIVIGIIRNAGGLSFLAHPGMLPDDVVLKVIDLGIDGIETIHPSHSNSQVNAFSGLAENYILLRSGGSDYHGGGRSDDANFGKFFIGENWLGEMKKRLELPFRNTDN